MAKHGCVNKILNNAYIENQNLNTPWLQSIQAILFENGLGYIWEAPNLLSSSLNRAGKCLQERLRDQYVQTWFG